MPKSIMQHYHELKAMLVSADTRDIEQAIAFGIENLKPIQEAVSNQENIIAALYKILRERQSQELVILNNA